MKEGEPELGGLQVPHGDVNSSTSVSGTQPAISESSQISQPTPIATPMPSTPPSSVSQTTPIPQPQPTTQSFQPADQLISQTFTTFSTQNKPSTQPPMSNFDTPHAASNFTEIANSRVSSSLPQSMQSQPQPQPRSQFPIQPSPITSDSRDVMLSSTAPKKSKKGLIIGSILITVFLIGIGAIILFGNVITNNSIKNSFENFVSYLMSDRDDSSVWNFNPDDVYAMDIFFQDIGSREASKYFKELNNRWQTFSRNNIDNLNQQYLTTISGDLDILESYAAESIITKDEMLGQYLVEGQDILLAYTPNYYIENSYEPSMLASQYMAAWDDYLNGTINLFKSYTENDCIEQGKINNICVEDKNIHAQNAYGQLMSSEENLKYYAENIKDEVKMQTEKLIIDMEKIKNAS